MYVCVEWKLDGTHNVTSAARIWVNEEESTKHGGHSVHLELEKQDQRIFVPLDNELELLDPHVFLELLITLKKGESWMSDSV